MLLCLVGICFALDYYRTKTEYYADYVDKWGIPEGIIKLNKSQVNKRYAHYRFESSQRKLRRVVYANSAGTPIDNTLFERSSILELKYTNDNRLIVTEFKNARNKVIVAYFWGGKDYDCIDIKTNKEGATSATPINTKADIKRFKLTRNETGHIIRREFKRHNGDDAVSACDENGIWGIAYHLDSLGRPIQICHLGSNGCHGFPDGVGVAKWKYEYDIYGNIFKLECLGEDGELILNESLWAIRKNISDENGNIETTIYYGTDSLPCFNINGFAVWKSIYDKKGYEIKRSYFDMYGNPCLDKNRVAGWSSEYNKKGYEIKRSFLGTDNNPCINKNGIYGWKAKYDEKGNFAEIIPFTIILFTIHDFIRH